MVALTRRAFLAVAGIAAAGVATLGRSPAAAGANTAPTQRRRNRRGVYSNTYSNTY